MNNQIQIGKIMLWVRDDERAAWDVGTARAVITGDEYVLRPFIGKPERLTVKTVVDIGANIGAFSVYAADIFPESQIIAIEADPDNADLLIRNTVHLPQVSVWQTAVLGDSCQPYAHLARHQLNAGGSYLVEAFAHRHQQAQFVDAQPLTVACMSIHQVLTDARIESIDILKVDIEGSEIEVFECLSQHGWLEKTRWLRFEWHGRDAIEKLREIISPTHIMAIDEQGIWNSLGIGHRRNGTDS